LLLKDTNICCHKTGDIIFTKSNIKLGDINVAAQRRIFKREEAQFSHIFICVTNGVFAEATLGKNIEVFSFKDDRESTKSEKWTVYRNKLISEDEELQKRIKDNILFHIGKRYDLKSLASYALHSLVSKEYKVSDDIFNPSAICSEFVAMVLKGVNEVLQCSLLEGNMKLLLPGDFEEHFKHDCTWEEVKYDRAKGSVDEQNLERKVPLIINEFREKMDNIKQIKEVEVKILQDIYDFVELMDKSNSAKTSEEIQELIEKYKSYMQGEENPDILKSIYQKLTFNKNKLVESQTSFSQKHYSLKSIDSTIENLGKIIHIIDLMDIYYIELINQLVKGTLDIYDEFKNLPVENIINNKELVTKITFIHSAFKYIPTDKVEFFKKIIQNPINGLSNKLFDKYIEMAKGVVKINELNLKEEYENISREIQKIKNQVN
jgi:hypothetical protein